jgi:hypothetical protein
MSHQIYAEIFEIFRSQGRQYPFVDFVIAETAAARVSLVPTTRRRALAARSPDPLPSPRPPLRLPPHRVGSWAQTKASWRLGTSAEARGH